MIKFVPGNKVRLVSGVYRGYEGELLSVTADGSTAYLRIRLGARRAVYAAREHEIAAQKAAS